jgi:type III pantothenate kinase
VLLAVDVGNTNIVIGAYDTGRRAWHRQWRIQTARDRMADEYLVLLRSLLAEEGLGETEFDGVTMASVVPPLNDVLADAFERMLGLRVLVIGPGIKTGIRIRTDNPAEVGADLVANAVAAYDRLGTNCIVVDLGTATTFTAVAQPGDLLGVAIAPGLGTSAGALSEKAAQLPRIPLHAPPAAIGRNTIHSMQAGLVYGHVGMVRELLSRMKAELGEAQAIATGGLSRTLAPLVGEFVAVDPALTLEGIRLIGERNAA